MGLCMASVFEDLHYYRNRKKRRLQTILIILATLVFLPVIFFVIKPSYIEIRREAAFDAIKKTYDKKIILIISRETFVKNYGKAKIISLLDEYNEIINSKSKTNSSGNFQKAFLCHILGRDKQAVECFKVYIESISLEEANKFKIPLSEAYFYRGLSKYYLDNFDESINDFRKSLEFNPSDNGCYYNRALCFYCILDYGKAMADLNYLINKDSGYDSAYVLRGYIYFNQLDCDNALKDLKKAIQLNPKNKNDKDIKRCLQICEAKSTK